MNGKIKSFISIAFLFILIAGLYTYPLIFNLSFMLPGLGQSDTPLSAWNIWHLKKIILSGHHPFIFNTKYIFYLQKPSLILHNYTLVTGLMSLPFQIFFNPLVSRNLLFFIQFILTGVGMYSLIIYFTNNKIAAFYSAITLAFSPYVMIRGYNYLHFSTIWYFPWFIYFIWRAFESNKPKYFIWTAIIYLLCFMEDLTYFIFLTILMFFISGFFLLKNKRIFLKKYTRNLTVALTILLILSLPYLKELLYVAIKSEAGLKVWPDKCIDYFSLKLHNLFRPSPILSLYRDIPYLPLPIKHVTNVFIGYVPLFFAMFAVLNLKNLLNQKRNIIFCWIIIGSFFLLVSLGPLSKFSLYNLLCSGILRQLRIPVRFSLVTLISIYILAGFGVERLIKVNKEKVINSKAFGIFLIILQIIEFSPMPYPLLMLKTPKVYKELAHHNIGLPILVLPLGWQSSYKTIGRYYKEIQFYQTVHKHPIFQGQIARIEDSYFNFYLSNEGFRYLINADKKTPTASERKAVYDILQKYNIEYVVIHRKYFDRQHIDTLLRLFKDYPRVISIKFI